MASLPASSRGSAKRSKSHRVPTAGRPRSAAARAPTTLAWAIDQAARRAQTGRVVVCIDELHRVDELSRGAFADLVSSSRSKSILIVGAHIPAFDPDWHDEAPSRRIAGLAFGAVLLLLKAHPSGERVRIDESARGYLPLYVEQVLRYSHRGRERSATPPRGSDRASSRHARPEFAPRAAGSRRRRSKARASASWQSFSKIPTGSIKPSTRFGAPA